MRRAIGTHIDADACIGCGECVIVCPSDAIAMKDGVAVVVGAESLECDHCAAVCPEGAVTVDSVDESVTRLETVHDADGYVAPGEADTAALVRIMRSRRSCRNYLDRPVPRAVLEDLVKIGITAPSGTNSQLWTFTIVPDRRSVSRLAERVGAFYRRLNRLAENGMARAVSKVLFKDALGAYYRDYYETVREGLEEAARGGRERLFHGAPAAILVGSSPGASCPQEDALLATQNILLGAHAMGLGTCLIGFAVEAIRRDPRIGRAIGLDRGERIYAVIAVGYPDERYVRPCRRRRIAPRVFQVAD